MVRTDKERVLASKTPLRAMNIENNARWILDLFHPKIRFSTTVLGGVDSQKSPGGPDLNQAAAATDATILRLGGAGVYPLWFMNLGCQSSLHRPLVG